MPRFTILVLFLFTFVTMFHFASADIIVESGSGGINNASYSEVGIKWQDSTSKSTAQGCTVGITARFCNLQVDATARDTALFQPLINTSGNYNVYVTWNLGNASTCRYQVFNNTGLVTTEYLLQDGYGQQGASNANMWLLLGTFSFASGSTGRVEVSSADANGVPGLAGNYRVYADAVKWVSNAPPVTPIASFSANQTTGQSPFLVNFTDNSLNNPTTWNWDFGDGNTSSAQNPSHSFSTSTDANFTIRMIVANPAGTDTSTLVRYIHVSPPLGAFAIAIDSVTHSGLIVDNLDAGFSATAGWSSTSIANQWKTNSRIASAQLSGVSNQTAWWRPSLSATSRYNVYVWYPASASNVIDAKYRIYYSGGAQDFYVDQTYNYGGWYYLGAYNFDSGTTAFIELTNATRTTSGSYNVIADAVMFEPIQQFIVDDGINFGTQYQQQGAWSTATAPKYFISTTARYSNAVILGTGTATATWRPNIPANGIYQVEVSYPSVITGQQVAKDVTYTVTHKNGSESVLVPENFHGSFTTGHWYSLGTFAFDSGTTGSVRLTNLAPLSSGRVVTADAIRFTTYSPLLALEGGELRAFWAHGIGAVGLRNITEVSAMVDTARLYNFNAIFAHGRVAGDSYYDSAYEPKCSALGSNTTFDAISSLIQLAHDTTGGKRYIEVHVWMNPFRDYRSDLPPTDTTIHLRYTQPTWWDQTNSGATVASSMQFSHPSIPGNQDYHIKVWMDLVRNYDVDGIHTDDYFYQGSTWGFNSIATSMFAAEYGFAPTSGNAQFSDWRRLGVTNYIRRFYAEALTVRPHLKWTVAPVASSSMTPYLSSSAYASEFNDWLNWYTSHYFDALVPEVYTGAYNATFTNNLLFSTATAKANNRHLYYGQGSYQTTTPTNIAMLYYSQLTARNHGSVLFDYIQFNSAGDNTGFLQAVVTTAYANPTTTAAMPWKSNPPGGILKGRVYSTSSTPYPYFSGDGVYKSLVTYYGPYGFGTTLTDGSGYYMMIDVPFGTYTVSVYNPPGNSGAPASQVIQVGVTRGVSTNIDFNLSPVAALKEWWLY